MQVAPGMVSPNHTLYIRGLDEKISKNQLRHLLYCLFSTFGQVLDVVALKTIRMRGQAFIVFGDIQEATTALRSLQGFPFLDKPLSIAFAKTRSHVLNVIQGSFKAPLKRSAEELETSRKKSKPDSDSDMEMSEDERNPILFISNVPSSLKQENLIQLCKAYAGFKEVRLVPGKKELAFVEYQTLSQAQDAFNVLNGFKVSETEILNVEFAKI